MPNSGQGTYSFDGSQPEFMLCEAKYFAQLNIHRTEEKPTDAEACQAIVDAETYKAKMAPASPPKAKTAK